MKGRSVLRSSLLRSLLLLVAVLLCRVQANAVGPPLNANTFNQICVQMLPSHGGSAQDGNGGYFIDTNLPFIDANSAFSYTAGQTYTGILYF